MPLNNKLLQLCISFFNFYIKKLKLFLYNDAIYFIFCVNMSSSNDTHIINNSAIAEPPASAELANASHLQFDPPIVAETSANLGLEEPIELRSVITTILGSPVALSKWLLFCLFSQFHPTCGGLGEKIFKEQEMSDEMLLEFISTSSEKPNPQFMQHLPKKFAEQIGTRYILLRPLPTEYSTPDYEVIFDKRENKYYNLSVDIFSSYRESTLEKPYENLELIHFMQTFRDEEIENSEGSFSIKFIRMLTRALFGSVCLSDKYIKDKFERDIQKGIDENVYPRVDKIDSYEEIEHGFLIFEEGMNRGKYSFTSSYTLDGSQFITPRNVIAIRQTRYDSKTMYHIPNDPLHYTSLESVHACDYKTVAKSNAKWIQEMCVLGVESETRQVSANTLSIRIPDGEVIWRGDDTFQIIFSNIELARKYLPSTDSNVVEGKLRFDATSWRGDKRIATIVHQQFYFSNILGHKFDQRDSIMIAEIPAVLDYNPNSDSDHGCYLETYFPHKRIISDLLEYSRGRRTIAEMCRLSQLLLQNHDLTIEQLEKKYKWSHWGSYDRTLYYD